MPGDLTSVKLLSKSQVCSHRFKVKPHFTTKTTEFNDLSNYNLIIGLAKKSVCGFFVCLFVFGNRHIFYFHQ